MITMTMPPSLKKFKKKIIFFKFYNKTFCVKSIEFYYKLLHRLPHKSFNSEQVGFYTLETQFTKFNVG